jgi:hypothetical protein
MINGTAGGRKSPGSPLVLATKSTTRNVNNRCIEKPLRDDMLAKTRTCRPYKLKDNETERKDVK